MSTTSLGFFHFGVLVLVLVLVLVCPCANKTLDLQFHKGPSNSSCSKALPPLIAYLYWAYKCANCYQLGLNYQMVFKPAG